MLEVIYEDNHLIAINKKSGDISQGDKTGDLPLSDYIKEYLKKKYNKLGNVYLGTIHRIDRPTSGVLVFAKTSKALSRMNELFRENKIQKTYWAVVKNQTPKTQGSLKNYLSKNNKQNKSYVCQENEGKLAELEYQTIKKLKNYYFLEIKPKTGRHHQIRVQLSNIGCPIKGDLKYGDKRSNKDQSIHLHARKIEFTHPVSKEILIITAPTPPDIIWNSIIEDLHQ
ncbi:MAG: RluA family pseudouridine synthase [Flavobacteriales bacterium]|jgi:23S rRNA pseudouridine1911/1915/1917 synthase|tara:strand:+ start:1568 stop:2245 length:678 start_codon:yes stop_codon:yes gene_type:complete